MKSIRTYSAYLLLVLFGCYYSSISLFSHAHIVGGVSVVHSHLGAEADHTHDDAQYAIIDILSQFQSESATFFCHTADPFYLITEARTAYQEDAYASDVPEAGLLRGPPRG